MLDFLSSLPFVKEIEYVDPEQILLRLAHEPNLCFLDSSKHHDSLGHYSYLAADPFLVIKSKNDIVTINGASFAGNPFDFLQIELQRYQSSPLSYLPPFQGGALGYFAYDLLHHLEDIPKAAQDDISAFDMYLGFYDCIIAFDHFQEKAWIISQGFPKTDTQQRQLYARKRAECLFEKVFDVVMPEVETHRSPFVKEKVASNFTRADYCQAIKKTIDYIYAGDIFQANITQCFSSELHKDFNPVALYTSLRKKNPAPFSAFLGFQDICIASASPERFIRLQNNIVETRPIKGTRPRGKTSEIDRQFAQELLNSEKDRAENTMIVDLMRNDLSRVCVSDSVIVTQLCKLESYESVHHLVSAIEAKLDPKHDAVSLLKATFPGGSITGAPKIRAMEIIYEIEPSARGVYCGSIGYIGFDGNMDTSIVIRTYIIKEDKIYFQAGGGIVADSIPEDEYEESLTKVSALKKVLKGEKKTHDFVY